MIPKFKKPIAAFALHVLAGASLLVCMLLAIGFQAELDPGTSKEWSEWSSPSFLVPVAFFAAAVVLFSLGELVTYAAQSAHFNKYICWEMRIANQLVEKKRNDRSIPSTPTPEELVTLEPLERVFRSAGSE